MARSELSKRQTRCPVEPDKVRYRSVQAVATASRLAEAERGVRLYFYECSWCGDWHLTSTPNDAS